jgi:hypothetical protein
MASQSWSAMLTLKFCYFGILTTGFFSPASTEVVTKTRTFSGSYYEEEYISGPYLVELVEKDMTMLQCAAACLGRSDCASYNYVKADGKCQLSGSVFKPCLNNVTLTKRKGTKHFTASKYDGKLSFLLQSISLVGFRIA